MSSKNIVIAPCGNRSFLFRESWLKFRDEKEFDLCLLFYHEHIEDPGRYEGIDHFFHLKGFKYHMIFELLSGLHPEWLEQYEYFYLLDDDIEIDTRQINTLFSLSKAFKSYISCAALTEDSFCSWPIFKKKPSHFCRYVGQIEVMAPLFDSSTLQHCLPSFIETRSSWGIDSVWSKILGYPVDKFIVFDTITMKHIHPVGKGELYQKIDVNPHQEWAAIIARYGAQRHKYEEYAKLYMVDKHNNRLAHLYFRYRNVFGHQKNIWKKRIFPSLS